MRGIRGAITVENDDEESIWQAGETLISEIMQRNQLRSEDIGAIIFSMTDDLQAAFPTTGVRRLSGFAEEAPEGLTATEQRLYDYFRLNKGRTLTRGQLLAHMWDSKNEFVSDNALSVAVNRIRGKLSGSGRIVTVKGVGYKWED